MAVETLSSESANVLKKVYPQVLFGEFSEIFPIFFRILKCYFSTLHPVALFNLSIPPVFGGICGKLNIHLNISF